MDVPPGLARTATEQLGVVTRKQVLGAGIGARELRAELGSRWRVVLPGVILLDPGLPSIDQRLVAAQLIAGPESWLAGPTAAALHGLPGAPDLERTKRIHVLAPPPARPRDVSWVSIRRTHLLDERITRRGSMRISCKARALVDAAATVSSSDGRAMIIGAVQGRHVRIDDVSHWIEARRPNGRLALRSALSEAAAGVWSLPEGDLVRLLESSTVIPEVMANPELHDDRGRRVTTPDVWIDDVAMAVMVHSRAFHAGDLDWETTVEGDSDLTSLRVTLVGVTPASIAREPDRVLRRVESAYLDARRSGFRAAVRATPRAAVDRWRSTPA